jgi:hypothetical protein
MADTIEVDLATLDRVFQDGLDAGLHTLNGCVPEISISPEMLAAIRAGKFGRIGNVICPSELSPATLAAK